MRFDLRSYVVAGKHHLLPVILLISLLAGCGQQLADSTTATDQLPTITVETLSKRIDSGAAILVLDVRTPEEYDGPLGHVEGSRIIPVQELPQRIDELADEKDKHIYVICMSGGRSARATRMLLDAGYRASNVAGGMRAWNAMMELESEAKGTTD